MILRTDYAVKQNRLYGAIVVTIFCDTPHNIFVQRSVLRPEVSIKGSILNSFADVLRFDRLFAFKVGESSTYF